MYGKLIDGKLIKAKHFIIDGKSTIINPTGEMYEKYGFKKIVESPIPELKENQTLQVSKEETETEIIKKYKAADMEEDISG